MNKSPFSATTIVLLVTAAVALFALSVLLSALDDPQAASGERSAPGAYSVSAIGHAALYDLLKRLDWEVSRGVGNTLASVGKRGLLVIAEPDLHSMTGDGALKLTLASKMLLVLPKWRGVPDPDRPTWIGNVGPVPLGIAQGTLDLVHPAGRVVRKASSGAWATNALGVAPAVSGPLQLVESEGLRPLVGGADGILVGVFEDGERTIWILSDPDVLANHGVGKGENAEFMLALLGVASGRGAGSASVPIVFDETVHGYKERRESPLKLLFTFPYVVLTILACAFALVVALAGTSRFGPARRAKPPLDFGKAKLIDNSARLLDYSGHQGVVLKRYVEMVVRQTARALHAPQGMDESELRAWLDRIGKSRRVSILCGEIMRRADSVNAANAENAPFLLQCARDIHRWKGEMVYGAGTGADRGDSGQHQG